MRVLMMTLDGKTFVDISEVFDVELPRRISEDAIASLCGGFCDGFTATDISINFEPTDSAAAREVMEEMRVIIDRRDIEPDVKMPFIPMHPGDGVTPRSIRETRRAQRRGRRR